MTSRPPLRTTFLRVGAIAAILGGILFAFADLQHPLVYERGATFAQSTQTPLWIWHQTTHLAAVALVLVGLPAIFLAQVARVGRAALVGYIGLLIGFAWLGAFVVGITMLTYIPGADLSSMDQGPPPGLFPQLVVLAFPVTFLSGVVFAIASWRARILPRPALVLLAISAPLDILGGSGGLLPLAGGVAMGIAFTWLGLRVWTLSRTENASDASARILATSAPESEG